MIFRLLAVTLGLSSKTTPEQPCLALVKLREPLVAHPRAIMEHSAKEVCHWIVMSGATGTHPSKDEC
jgi:hypothetical protein